MTYKIQLENIKSVHSSSTNVDCENSSLYNNFIFSVGGNLSRIEVTSSINSSDINFNIKGLYLAKNSTSLKVKSKSSQPTITASGRPVIRSVI